MEQVQAVADAHRQAARQRGIDIEVNGDGSLEVNGDGERIQTAIAKLLENAISIPRMARERPCPSSRTRMVRRC